MNIDFDHHQGAIIAQETITQIYERCYLQMIEMLKPSFALDGNMYCYTYGELPNDCVQGFGETPYAAMENFYKNFTQQKAPQFPRKEAKDEK